MTSTVIFVKKNTNASYFIEIPILSQIANLYKKPDFKNLLTYNLERQKINNNNYEDI